MSKKITAPFYLITLIGVLGLVGSACGRSTTQPGMDPVQTSKPTIDAGPAEAIEPDSERTGNDNPATAPIDMGDAGTEATAEGNQASNDQDSPDSPDSNNDPTPTGGETPEEGGEPPAGGPTYGDGGGGIPYNPGQEGPSNFYGLPSGEILRQVTATRTPGSVNVFFRNSQGHLCRVMGPPELVWGSVNRPQTACFDAYTIDRPPQVVYDPNRRKIYAFAPDVTGDLGQAHGFRFYVCEADSIRCTASTQVLWESRLHFYPAIVFVKGATPAQDRIVGFSHAGDGGRLAYFTVDPESLRHGWGYVGPKLLSGASVTACGEWASIDRSPVAFFRETSGGEALDVMARTGEGDLLHLQMSASRLSAFKRGEGDLQFSCRKISETYQGRDGLGNMGTRRRPFSLSPSAVWRGGGSIDVFGGVQSGDFNSGASARLWSIGLGSGAPLQHASWLEAQTTPSAWGPSLDLSFPLAAEERLAVVPESSAAGSMVHLFANVRQGHPLEGTQPDITIHGLIGPGGDTKTLEVMPVSFGGQPAAVMDDKGNLHVFGASYETGPTGHFRLLHAARPADGGLAWLKFAIAAGQSIQKGGRGSGESGVTAVWVPGKSFRF